MIVQAGHLTTGGSQGTRESTEIISSLTMFCVLHKTSCAENPGYKVRSVDVSSHVFEIGFYKCSLKFHIHN